MSTAGSEEVQAEFDAEVSTEATDEVGLKVTDEATDEAIQEAAKEAVAEAGADASSGSVVAEVEDGILEMAGPAEESLGLEADVVPEGEIRSALEAILFAAAEPIPLQRLSRLFQGQGRGIVKKALETLQGELAEGSRGIRLVEVSSGYQFRSAPEHASWLRRFFAEKPPRLSRALLETVSIIAYRQPVTRGEIEAIRGVNCDAILSALLNRDLILATGRRDTPGRPVEYGTTSDFLELFTMRDLSELPPLPDAESLANLLKEDALSLEETDSPVVDEVVTLAVGDEETDETLPEGGFGKGLAGDDAGSSDGLEADDPLAESAEQLSSGETADIKSMAAAAGGGGSVEESSEIEQVSESGQVDGTDGANSENSQPGGSGLPSGGRGPDS